MSGKRWSSFDTQKLIDHYPAGGAKAVQPHLKTSHELHQIRAKAKRMNIQKNQPFKKCEVTKALLDALEKAYTTGRRPNLKPVADRFDVSRNWLYYVAQTRGLATTKNLQWGEEVDAMIREMEGVTPERVYSRLRAAGFRYPLTAVAKRQQQLRVSNVDDNLYSPTQIASALGLNRARVMRWVKTGRLSTTKRSTCLGATSEMAVVSSKALRDFIVDHPGEIDLRRITPAWQPWFIDLLTNKTADHGVGFTGIRVA
ncbi:hypothetical protein [Salinicola sp. CPA57]|uniref:hypothetical protein n=1 Tax=Salinicola sp. CPA57 TaxID=1949080 RepID=UPI000DA1D43A|nr:hypothetical protein [Salinicola sp. CPA57]